MSWTSSQSLSSLTNYYALTLSTVFSPLFIFNTMASSLNNNASSSLSIPTTYFFNPILDKFPHFEYDHQFSEDTTNLLTIHNYQTFKQWESHSTYVEAVGRGIVNMNDVQKEMSKQVSFHHMIMMKAADITKQAEQIIICINQLKKMEKQNWQAICRLQEQVNKD